ncbi:MAG: hypothetical protein NWE95_10745 [Candidatus Bathyarchaeota archaeon]|nr:hypothetical protein [Candidatus Bathyarchaeota archaeon]
MQSTLNNQAYADRKLWFSMWFLGAIVTFGAAFFPMFYRLVEGRNKHFQKEAEIEKQIADYLKSQGKEPPKKSNTPVKVMNAKAWAASIIFVVPVFVIVYLLSKDLVEHEQNQDAFLAAAFPERMFMPQTIPITKYALVTLVTLGVGVIYWLYKVVNLYNAHFKAHSIVEKEISRLMEEQKVVEHM